MLKTKKIRNWFHETFVENFFVSSLFIWAYKSLISCRLEKSVILCTITGYECGQFASFRKSCYITSVKERKIGK